MKYSTIKEEIFGQIYEKYQHDIYKISLYYVKDEHVAQDIAQRAFMGLYLKFENVRPEKIFPYLTRSVRNISYNWLQDFKRLHTGQIEDVNDEDLKEDSVEDTYLRGFEQDAAMELCEDIMGALYARNQRWYEAITLSYYFDIQQTEVAEHLGIAPDVLYNRICRARKWIRAHYAEKYEEYLKKKLG